MSTIAPADPPIARALDVGPTSRRRPGVLRNRSEDPVRVRPALLALLGATTAATAHSGAGGASGGPVRADGGRAGGLGGLLNGTPPATSWPPATRSMAIGGFNGTDPAPTLEQFQAEVAAGRIHYFLGGRGLGGTTASQITGWVTSSFPATTVGGATVYDLTVA